MTYCKGISCSRPDSNPGPGGYKTKALTITPGVWIKVEAGTPADIHYPELVYMLDGNVKAKLHPDTEDMDLYISWLSSLD